MANLPLALDLTDAVAYRCASKTPEVRSAKIPCVLLPLHPGEPPIAGVAAELHRRGSGLPWPPECQVPVSGISRRGTGRIPVVALWAKLVDGERAGLFADTHPSAWQPHGDAPIVVETVPLLSAAITAYEGDPAVVVIPDSLGPAGQQALLDALPSAPHLIPVSIATALAWCRSRKSSDSLFAGASSGDGTPVGHVVVLHAGWGRWEASQILVRAVLHENQKFLTPVFARQRRIVMPAISGAALMARDQDIGTILAAPWRGAPVPAEKIRGLGVRRVAPSPLAAWAPLMGEGNLARALEPLRAELAGNGPIFMGVLIAGEWADAARAELAAMAPALKFFTLPAGAAALGACLAEASFVAGEPFWREELAPLDFHCLGRDEFGDPAVGWKPLVAVATVDAWTEFRPAPICGLSIPAGADNLALTLRAPLAEAYEYRRITARLIAPLEREHPVMLDVRVNPGQGFARVEVNSVEPGVFNSRLEWGRLQPTGKPESPKLGYIPRSVILRSDAKLWADAVIALENFVATSSRDPLFDYATKSVTVKLNRWPSADLLELRRGNRQHTPNRYLFYSAIGSDGKLPSSGNKAARELWFRTCDHALASLASSRPVNKVLHNNLRRMLSWGYSACPEAVVKIAESALRQHNPEGIDLDTAGLCFRSNTRISLFWKTIAQNLRSVSGPCKWLRAVRNLARLNEHALAGDMLSDETMDRVTNAVFHHFSEAVASKKRTTTGDSMEALLHLLKRRRYRPDFLHAQSPLRTELDALLSGALPFLSKRHTEMRHSMLLLLRHEAGEADLATLVVTDEADGDGDGN